jgi:hypothetical protein
MSEPYTYKPCPVCGKNDNISMDSMSHKGYYWVRCMGTHFDDEIHCGPVAYTKENAKKFWDAESSLRFDGIQKTLNEDGIFTGTVEFFNDSSAYVGFRKPFSSNTYLIKVWDNYKNAYYIQSQTNHGFLILAAKVTKGLVHWKVSLDKE